MNAEDIKPTCPCSQCEGSGENNRGKVCEWCNGLGGVFSSVIFRGHPEIDGEAEVIEGHCPVVLGYQLNGVILLFERAYNPVHPHWFVKEDGKQVYRYKGKL